MSLFKASIKAASCARSLRSQTRDPSVTFFELLSLSALKSCAIASMDRCPPSDCVSAGVLAFLCLPEVAGCFLLGAFRALGDAAFARCALGAAAFESSTSITTLCAGTGGEQGAGGGVANVLLRLFWIPVGVRSSASSPGGGPTSPGWLRLEFPWRSHGGIALSHSCASSRRGGCLLVRSQAALRAPTPGPYPPPPHSMTHRTTAEGAGAAQQHWLSRREPPAKARESRREREKGRGTWCLNLISDYRSVLKASPAKSAVIAAESAFTASLFRNPKPAMRTIPSPGLLETFIVAVSRPENCSVAPRTLSMRLPSVPAAAVKASAASLSRSDRPEAVAANTTPIPRAPATLASVPYALTPPLVPLCTRRHGGMTKRGSYGESTPFGRSFVRGYGAHVHAEWCFGPTIVQQKESEGS